MFHVSFCSIGGVSRLREEAAEKKPIQKFCLNDEKPGTNLPPQKKSTNIQQTEINVVKNSQDLSKSLNFQLLLTLFLKKIYFLAPHV